MATARSALSAALAVISLTGCDATAPFESSLREIAVEPFTPTLQVGDTVTVAAIGYVTGIFGVFLYDPLRDAVWRVSDSTVARLERLPPPAATDSYPKARILLRGLSPGRVDITASARGYSGIGTAVVTAR